ncbi:Aluminum-activated malate transporter 10 [Acorus calamus]|uniref:Aluminum-activated malate transporter 10 n=1 Tax=Acorus calamus TaxID=4465 RepID=A0AAV9DVZ4_ACOCL|nr:Aluminum-activated malate transporter 10 [Acorus calamus]
MSSGLEWRVTMPDGASVKLLPKLGIIRRAWTMMLALFLALKSKMTSFIKKAWKIGVDEPKKVIHCLKVGMGLSLVSLFYYTRPLYDGVGGNAMWAVMTVVVVFEYTVGGTLYKGFNRATATLLAGSLGVGVHWLASKSGNDGEPIILGISLFILASAATFSRFLPEVKSRFDYGVSIFILTFSLVLVSGYRVDKLFDLAQQRLSTIAIGISMCILISILVFPVWAGNDLHLLITRNMDKLAESVDGCISEYFNEGNARGEEEPTCKKSQSYKCVLNSKASEESLANLARWEPGHGRFGFRYPWKQYLKIGGAMRHCACCLEALSGCINSEIQAPDFIKKHLSEGCKKLSSNSTDVLKELSSIIKSMKRSPNIDSLLADMSASVDDLQNTLKSLTNQTLLSPPPPSPVLPGDSPENQSVAHKSTVDVPLMGVLPVVMVASLLIEIASRIEDVTDTVNDLAALADFKAVEDLLNDEPPVVDENENMKTLQEV